MMRLFVFGTVLALAAACEPVPGGSGNFAPVSEEVVAAADPAQDVATARVLDDGCYWYEHNGPVERTLLPLRTVDGRPICALSREERAAAAAAEAAAN